MSEIGVCVSDVLTGRGGGAEWLPLLYDILGSERCCSDGIVFPYSMPPPFFAFLLMICFAHPPSVGGEGWVVYG